MRKMLKSKVNNIIKIFLVIIILVSVSCGNREQRTARRDLIPQKDLVPVLTDIYLTDGLLINYEIRQKFTALDSTINHSRVIEKHGYTKRQLDLTLKYYFINNPKKLQKIFDQVLAKLSEIQSGIETEPGAGQGENLWNLKENYKLPNEGAADSIFFSIPVKDTGIYTLSFSSVIFSNDQNAIPRSIVYFWRPDSSGNGIKDLWEPVIMKKDGKEHQYTVSRRLTDTSFMFIRGMLYESVHGNPGVTRHAKFSKISLIKEKAE